MNLFENIRLAFSSLIANKMRALLTMLGIIIGIGSVIGIMTLGDSLTGYMTSSMQGMGANNILLSIRQREEAPDTAMPTEQDMLTVDMIANIAERYADVIDSISVSESIGSGRASEGSRYANLSLSGVNTDYINANNLTMLSGRFLSQRDLDGSKKVAVVSDMFVKNMFGRRDPLGQQVTLTAGGHTGTYTIVGVYQYDMMTMGFSFAADKDVSTAIYIPITTAQKITGNKVYSSLTLVTAAGSDSEAFAAEVESYINSIFYARNPYYSVSAFSMKSMLDTLTDMLTTLQIAIAAIAAISLLVGGIGVMNIMLVSITERTKEIGTRKALGATNGEIRIQFIVEAVIICLVGGVIGILLGMVLGMFGASLLGFPAEASLFSIILATGFSLVIGVFFGYYPANKAARLDPIEALRYE